MPFLDFQAAGAYVYACRVRDFTYVFDLGGVYIFPGAAREAVDEGEVPLLHSLCGYAEESLRAVGPVFRGVAGRHIVLSGIDPEHREVSRMARPHPVVGVASELAYRRRRRADETYVRIFPVYEYIVYVAVVHRLYACAQTLALRSGFLDESGGIGTDDGVALALVHSGLIAP